MNDTLKPLIWEDAVNNGLTGASGKVYILESELSAERYYRLQEFMIEVYGGISAGDLIKGVGNAYQSLNAKGGPKVADASVQLHNVLSASKKFGNRSNAAVKAVCLFFNEKGQSLTDRKSFDESEMNAKAADLEAVYGFGGFFPLLERIMTGSKKS